MSGRSWKVLAGLCALAVSALGGAPARAQMSEVKEKPPMYSYVSFWNIPRAKWADMAKSDEADKKILDKALADGTIVGYGNDVNLVHQPDGETNDGWWSSMSMAGLIKVLEEFYKSGSATSPVLESATKHWDGIFVSRYYNWHAGSWKGLYTLGAYWRLKPDAPNDAVEKLSKHLIVPLMEKLLADGTIHEYEVDTEAVHTEAPGAFWIFYLGANAEALDKAHAALLESLKANPLAGPAFGSMVEFEKHRDFLARTSATYK